MNKYVRIIEDIKYNVNKFYLKTYGIYSFIKLDIIKHIKGDYGFSMNDGNIIINILRYLGLITMFSITVKFIDKLIKNRRIKNE